MNGWRGGVSAEHAKVHHRRNQDRHTLVLCCLGLQTKLPPLERIFSEPGPLSPECRQDQEKIFPFPRLTRGKGVDPIRLELAR